MSSDARPIGIFMAESLQDSAPHLFQRSGDYPQMFSRGMGVDIGEVRAVSLYDGTTLPAPDAFAGIIITGAPAMVTDQLPWAERAAEWIARHLDQVPLLGVCFGHQLIGHALGGTVEANPGGPAYGTTEVNLLPAGVEDALLSVLPARCRLQCAHHQRLAPMPTAVPLASGSEGLQAARFGRRTWGVQFHPEFDADDSAAIVTECGQSLAAYGLDVARVRGSIGPSPDGPGLLRRFAGLVRGAGRGTVGCQ